jgi:hypothetical protein
MDIILVIASYLFFLYLVDVISVGNLTLEDSVTANRIQ